MNIVWVWPPSQDISQIPGGDCLTVRVAGGWIQNNPGSNAINIYNKK